MELNQRYLNRQLGRVVRTLGFDREWVHGRGPYLIDAEGDEYLDLTPATACSRWAATTRSSASS